MNIDKVKYSIISLVAGTLVIAAMIMFSGSAKGVPPMDAQPVPNNDKNISSTSAIRADFYSFDKKTGKKGGKLLGSAKLENGKLSINTKDPNLEKLLKSEIIGRGGSVKEEVMPNGKKVIIGGMQLYKPGTKEHLESIIQNARAYGYYAERQK